MSERDGTVLEAIDVVKEFRGGDGGMLRILDGVTLTVERGEMVAIVGASGAIEGTQVLQIKGFPYSLADLVSDPGVARTYRNGVYVTLRLTASMYHRFHALHDCRVESVTYISGDTWNVNPIALKRVEALFCKNERAVLRTRLDATGHAVTLRSPGVRRMHLVPGQAYCAPVRGASR